MKTGIGVYIFILLLNISVGAWSVIEILSWFGKKEKVEIWQGVRLAVKIITWSWQKIK